MERNDLATLQQAETAPVRRRVPETLLPKVKRSISLSLLILLVGKLLRLYQERKGRQRI
jgi:hypothetical protein